MVQPGSGRRQPWFNLGRVAPWFNLGRVAPRRGGGAICSHVLVRAVTLTRGIAGAAAPAVRLPSRRCDE